MLINTHFLDFIESENCFNTVFLPGNQVNGMDAMDDGHCLCFLLFLIEIDF